MSCDCGGLRPNPGQGAPGGTLPAAGEQGSFLQTVGGLWVPSAYALPTAAPGANEVLVGSGGDLVYADHAPARSYILFGVIGGVLTGTSFITAGGGGGSGNSVTPITALNAKTASLYAGTGLGCTAFHNALTGATDITYTILKITLAITLTK